MPLPSLGFLRLTPPKPEDVGAPSSDTRDLIERVRDYHVNRERRVFFGAETGNVQLINDNVDDSTFTAATIVATRPSTWPSTPPISTPWKRSSAPTPK